MTNPNPDYDAIVDLMVQRLRALQAVGESELINREIVAGSGLYGGGTLASDIRIALDQPSLADLERARRSVSTTALNETLEDYVTEAQLASQLGDYLPRIIGHKVYVLPFSHPGMVTDNVDAPPLAATHTGILKKVAVSVAETGAALTVTLNGRSFTLPAGQERAVFDHGGPITEGSAINLSLDSTGVRGVTVSVRIHEAV